LFGVTAPLREWMAWTRQQTLQYEVLLPEGPQTTRVVILDDFVSFGWSHYATCGRRATGGWACADALYAVRPRYPSLASEEFRVTFLGHEAQHLADMARAAVVNGGPRSAYRAS
jgi:hypothetical protein